MKRRGEIEITGRKIGYNYPPFIIAEVGINHDGEYSKAIELIDAAAEAGADCVKFQCHIVEHEMICTDMKLGKISNEKLWDIIKRCELTEEQELKTKKHCEKKGIIYLSTPFSKEAVDRLQRIGVSAFKIGSGECNNTPLIDYITRKGKPIILSTGMNNISSIKKSIEIIKKCRNPFMLMHCVSIYPTPYDKLRLKSIVQLHEIFKVPVGLSDHSAGIYTCLGAVTLGACALEKHFTISRKWPGPDNSFSIEPDELADLVKGAKAVWQARDGDKKIFAEEEPIINFAYACVVAIRDIKANELFTLDNIWVKRPGNGEIKAEFFNKLLNRKARANIKENEQIKWKHVYD